MYKNNEDNKINNYKLLSVNTVSSIIDYSKIRQNENNNIIKEHDGAFIIDGGLHIKEVNALLGTSFNYSEAKTLNGLIVEQLENMPQVGSEITIDNYSFNIISIEENIIDKIKSNFFLNYKIPSGRGNIKKIIIDSKIILLHR